MPVFSSTGTIHATGATLTLSGSVTLSGTIDVESGGVLVVSAAPMLSVTSPITLNGGVLMLAGDDAQTIGTIAGRGDGHRQRQPALR